MSKFTGANLTGGVTKMSFPIGANGATYLQSDISNLPNIEPFSAYFVQIDADIENNGMSFDASGRHLAPSAVALDLSERVKLNFTTTTGTDYSNLLMDESQSTEYEMNKDLEKMIGIGTSKPQVYTILGGINYVYNALPVANVNNLAIGFYSNAATETMISAVANAPSLSSLILTDADNGNETDLLTNSYSFTPTEGGTNNSRFTITAYRVSTHNVLETETNGPKLTVNDSKLKIENLSGKTVAYLYDTTGRVVGNKTTENESIEIQLPALGMYTVQLQWGGKMWTKKIVNH